MTDEAENALPAAQAAQEAAAEPCAPAGRRRVAGLIPPPAWRRRLVGVALASLLIPAVGQATQSDTGIHLGDLSHRWSVAPASFMITSTAAMHGLRWSNWGAPTATAVGALTVNTCQPTCAAGKTKALPATLEVRGDRLDHGKPYYGEYRVVSPAFAPGERASFSTWTRAYIPSDFVD